MIYNAKKAGQIMADKMTSPKMSYEEAKYEAAEKRSKHNCSSGYPDFDKEVRRLLRIGFEDGSDFGAKYERDQAAKLVEALKLVRDSIEHISDEQFIVMNRCGIETAIKIFAEYEAGK